MGTGPVSTTRPGLHAAPEYDDIQGLVRYGHGHLSDSCFLLLQIQQADAARQWLEAAPVTSAATSESPPDFALQVAFSAPGLIALGVPESVIAEFDLPWQQGMSGNSGRSRRLGDVGASDPTHWDWGGESATAPHVLLLLYSQRGRLAEFQASLQDEVFDTAFLLVGDALTASAGGMREHFAFVDGISQPAPDWEQKLDPVSERDYRHQMALGELLLGYANEYGQYTARPLVDASHDPAATVLPPAAESPHYRDLGRNGSYLVLRQLEQNPHLFWSTLNHLAQGDEQRRDELAAAMVGRQRDGTPLEPFDQQGNTPPDSRQRANDFTFNGDPLGQVCPLGAHIRRANPRTGDFPPGANTLLKRLLRQLGFPRRHPGEDLIASTRFHRILRRGRVYGDVLSPEAALAGTDNTPRGLHFICLGTDLARQFEFVQNAWIASAHFAGLGGESDPLLGTREPLPGGEANDSFSLPREGCPAHRVSGLPRFVTLRGGGYFFLPGLRALRYLCTRRDGENH